MQQLNFPYELSISADEECEHISDEIMLFNAKQVPFSQKITLIFKRYVIKDNNKKPYEIWLYYK